MYDDWNYEKNIFPFVVNGYSIKRLRKSLGFTQKAFGIVTGIKSTPNVEYCLLNKKGITSKKPNKDTYDKIRKYFDSLTKEQKEHVLNTMNLFEHVLYKKDNQNHIYYLSTIIYDFSL